MTDRDELDFKGHQLEATVALRSSQDQVLWTMFGLFVAANALLLVGIFPMAEPPTNAVVTGVSSTI